MLSKRDNPGSVWPSPDATLRSCFLLGVPKSWMRDGYALAWGVETPNEAVSTPCRVLKIPYAFAVGVPVTYVQAPKAKGHRSRASFGFPTPRSRVYKGCLRGRTANVFPESG